MTADALSLERRLERWRIAHGVSAATAGTRLVEPRGNVAELMATTLDGEVVRTEGSTIVRLERPSRPLPVDRERLARLPGQPDPGVPLLCLDTETTGLGSAAGIFAFLVGLGWWEGDRFRQVQFLLPDQGDEPALLAAVAAALPSGGWLVSYNGRGFDWPLLETRYRLRRAAPPALAGHLDLLPLVRRVFRHRLPDARLRSVERHVLGLERIGDVEGAQIPGLYLEVLRGASPALLADVIHHNDLDVRTLGLLVAALEDRYAGRTPRDDVPAGDLAGLARAYRREARYEEALACLDAALARADDPGPSLPRWRAGAGSTVSTRGRARDGDDATEPWWSPGRAADVGGRPRRATSGIPTPTDRSPWTFARIAAERARLLRTIGRHEEASLGWLSVASGGGRTGVLAWVEIAKLREHRLDDVPGALDGVRRAWALLERERQLGRPDPRLERALVHRAGRLRRRLRRTRAA
jgi:tetratricopeptide (TPR) repeat protein